MAEKTGIAWTTSSWSPWIGCTEVSPGCDHCYARELDKRHRYGGAVHWGAGVPRYRTKSWDMPIGWNKKASKTGERWTVFPSLCDPFDNEVPELWRFNLWSLIWSTPNLSWLLLTKRIGNVPKMLPEDWGPNGYANVWLGASVVNQEEADRDVPKLLATSAAKRFVSYEPALGSVDFRCWLRPNSMVHSAADLNTLSWLIVGGESAQGGAKARQFDVEWARSTIRQCKAAGVACFVKQLGSAPFTRDGDCGYRRIADDAKGRRYGFPDIKDRAGADPAEWPENLRVQEFPA